MPGRSEVTVRRNADRARPAGRPGRGAGPRGVGVGRVALIVVSLLLFVLSLELMREGAGGLGALFREGALVGNPVQGLGFGWLLAYVVLSGSPVAAASLTLLSEGATSTLETFAMIAGSRLGASMVVILLGLLYLVRGRQTREGLRTGGLAMAVTVTVYLPALLLGLVVLDRGWVSAVSLDVPVVETVDRLYGPVVDLVAGSVPGAAVFALGIAVMVGSFALFDRALPEVTLGGAFGGDERLVFRPVVMFLAGLGVTALTFSVSISVGLLVPLSARGLIRRENIIPYVMGCNVSTFVDAVFVAVLLQSPAGVAVVLTAMGTVALVSLLFLTLGFGVYERLVNGAVDRILERPRNRRLALAGLVVIPLLLLAVR